MTNDLFFVPAIDDGSKKPIKREKFVGLRTKSSRTSLLTDDVCPKILTDDRSYKDLHKILNCSNDNNALFRIYSPSNFKYFYRFY